MGLPSPVQNYNSTKEIYEDMHSGKLNNQQATEPFPKFEFFHHIPCLFYPD